MTHDHLYIEELLEELAGAMRTDPAGTLADLPRGLRHNCHWCPIAHWVRDRTGGEVTVDYDERIGEGWCRVTVAGRRIDVVLPKILTHFVWAFDMGQHPKLDTLAVA